MYNIQKFNNDKATVCIKNTCATVYGDTAKIVQAAVVVVTIIASALFIAKLAKSI
jgi:hypothetical protein